MFPPTEFVVFDALLIVPLDSATPPIEFDTPPGVEIAPVAKMVVCPLLSSELDISHPPIEFEDAPALLMVPFDSTTPPIEFDTPPGVEIAPVARIVICPLLSSELESVHPPIVLDVAVAFEIVPLLSRTLAIVYELHPKFPEMFPPTFRLFVIVVADIVVIPVAESNVKASLPAAEGYPPSL
jgi:hypothetical protein